VKGKYTSQYDLTLDPREMGLLVEALVRYVEEFLVTPETCALRDELQDVFQGEVPRPPKEAIPA